MVNTCAVLCVKYVCAPFCVNLKSALSGRSNNRCSARLKQQNCSLMIVKEIIVFFHSPCKHSIRF